jgi:hypothetical protein
VRRRARQPDSNTRCSAPKLARAGAKRSEGAFARGRGVRGGARAPWMAGTGRGRRGRSGELVSAPKCTRRREIERGILLTVRRRGRRARRRRGCDGGGAWQQRRVGRRSGVVGVRLLKVPGTKTCGSTSSVSPRRTKGERNKGGGVCPSPAVAKNRGGDNGEWGCSSACTCKRWAKGQAGGQAQP